MRKRPSLFVANLIFILLSFISFYSCEVFRSDTPISESINSKISDDFSGEWILLDQNDTLLHPLIKLRLIPYNEHEYIVTALFLSSNGRGIKSVENYKAFTSLVSGDIYFNVKELSLVDKDYFFIKVKVINENQVEVQNLLDSFTNEINTSIGLRENLEREREKIEENYLSDKFTYHRSKALKWDKINILYNTNDIINSYEFTNVTRSDFMNYSNDEIRRLIPGSKKVPVNEVITRLNDLYLSTNSRIPHMMKFPICSVVEFKSGKLLKIVYDESGSSVSDLTNDQFYVRGKY